MCNPFSIIEDIAAAVGTAVLGPAVGGAILGAGEVGAETLGGALVGGGLGAATSAAQGGNPLTGALTGAAGGAISPNLSDIGTSTAASDTTANTATGAPTVTPPAGASATAAPTGSFASPTDINTLGQTQISAATGGADLGQTGGTQLGGESFASGGQSLPSDIGTPQSSPIASVTSEPLPDVTSGAAGGNTAGLGPVNSTPSLSTPAANLQTGGADLSGGLAPEIPTTAPSAADTAFVNGQPSPSGSGLGPTTAAAANLPPAATEAPSLLTNISQGNYGTALGQVGTAIGGEALKNIPSLLAAGFAGAEALQGPAPLSSAGQALEAQGNTLNAAANTGLAAANAGTITESQTATIQQYVQNQQNQLYQQLASQGVSNPSGDSRFIQGMQQIQQQAQTMTANYIQQNFTNAMAEAGAGAQDLAQAANEVTQSDNSYSSALASATAAIGGSFALGNLTQKAA